ncbi:MAG: hypothetical protein JOZ69_10150 [Myxococcales bacterium]|nr:hypothetical protein [Myxococcales bacterium]
MSDAMSDLVPDNSQEAPAVETRQVATDELDADRIPIERKACVIRAVTS